MLRLMEVRLPLAHTPDDLADAICRALRIPRADLLSYRVARRGYDARHADHIVIVYTLDVSTRRDRALQERHRGNPRIGTPPDTRYRLPWRAPRPPAPRPIVIGLGPAGLFAGLVLAQMGLCPLILERGKPVRERTQDTFALWRRRTLDPESNVQFGEGGAGTFSDGKLHSQISDPHHYGRKVLEEFVQAGAPPEILTISKPHIGTFRLVGVVERMRATIEALGGTIAFQSRVVDIDRTGGTIQGLTLADGRQLEARHVILAIGHSARDTFAMLAERGVFIEAKPFAVGLRIEHPQSLIDRARFGRHAGHPLLGAADYKLAHHGGRHRSAYSFCMCPGGTVVAATSEVGRVVTNGMSQYSRNERNANSAIVVGVSPADFPGDALAGVRYQQRLEEQAFRLGGGTYEAPAQRLEDFLAGRVSTGPGEVIPSYQPGVQWTDLHQILPEPIDHALREALPAFARKVTGFALPDAVLTGVETRTSSPIRITRNDDHESRNTRGLYPTGEGAGYAGGILSAAVDGIKAAEAVARALRAGQKTR